MPEPTRAVFLSYASQDADAAKRICDALRAAGVEVWFDQSELLGGDAWDTRTRRQIADCALFVTVISANTQARREGYFRLEWKLAAQRMHMIADDVPFLLPVVIDETRESDARVPAEFKSVQWTRLPGGETPAAFCTRVGALLSGTDAAKAAPPSAASPRASAAFSSAAAPRPTAADLSLIVKPFDAIGDAADVQDIAGGLTEEVIGDLAKIRALRVISRSAVARFRGSTASAREIAAEANVRYVVTGTVRRGGARVRVNCEVADAVSDRVSWSERFDGSMEDPFALQETVARGIAGALQVRLTAEDEARLTTRPIADPRAAECARRAMAALSLMTAAGIEQARALLQQARSIVGRNSQILGLEAAASFQYVNLGIETDPDRVALRMAQAEALVAEAISLEPTQPDALFTRAWWTAAAGRMDEAMRDCVLALRVDPNHLAGRSLFGFICAWSGLREELRQNVAQLTALDPWHPWGSYQQAVLLTYEGSPAERDAAINRMLALLGGAFGACLATVLWGLTGEWERARPALEASTSVGGNDLGVILARAYLGALDREAPRVLALLAPLREVASIENDLDWQHLIAVAYALVGAHESALACLTKAVHHGFADPVLVSPHNRTLAPLFEGKAGTELLLRAEAQRQTMRRALTEAEGGSAGR